MEKKHWPVTWKDEEQYRSKKTLVSAKDKPLSGKRKIRRKEGGELTAKIGGGGETS